MLFVQIAKSDFYLNSYLHFIVHLSEFIFFHCFLISTLNLISPSFFFISGASICAFDSILSLIKTLFVFHFQINFQMLFIIRYFMSMISIFPKGQILTSKQIILKVTIIFNKYALLITVLIILDCLSSFFKNIVHFYFNIFIRLSHIVGFFKENYYFSLCFDHFYIFNFEIKKISS